MAQKYPFSCEELDQIGCANPECREDHRVIYFHSKCHPDAGTWASFDKATGTVTIECLLCRKHLIEVLVAPSRGKFRADLFELWLEKAN